MAEHLHVFAINRTLDLRHTHLSRHQGDRVPELPPLAAWLGGNVDLDQIELFPITDLEGLGLSSYVETAFAVEDGASKAHARRMDALLGHVLLVPSDAEFAPGPEATLIASLPMATANRSTGPMPKADVTGASHTPPRSGLTRLLKLILI